MKRTTLFVAALALCAGGTALAQEKKPDPKPATQPAAKPADKGAAQPSEAEMMKAWMEANTTGENHRLLQRGVGTWNAKGKFWMSPEAPPTESTGTSVCTSLMDGRFTKIEYTGDPSEHMPGWTGLGYYGYNNGTGKFESFWMDSMSTGMMTQTGTYNAAKKEFNWTGTWTDPLTKETVKTRSVEKFPNDNTMILEMYETRPGKSEFKNLEIAYSRTGGVKPAPAPAKK